MQLGSSTSTITAVASVACFATITGVAQVHFVRDRRIPVGTVAIVIAALTSVALFLWSVWTAPRDTIVPVPLYAAALALFFWTIQTTRNKGFVPSFSKVVPRSLTVNGPYKYVRHPFYVSYLMYHLSNAVATVSWLPWAMFALMLSLYLAAAQNEENYLVKGTYAEAYAVYKRRTGMFFPRLWPS